MIRLLIFILLCFIGYSLVQALLRPRNNSSMPRNRTRQGEKMVEDPQCGTFLPESDAISARIDGQDYYFCSKKCLREYKKKQ